MKIKCRIGCQTADCPECAVLLVEHQRRCEQMLTVEKVRIVNVSKEALYNCYLDAVREKAVVLERVKFYEQKLREQGLLPKEEKRKAHPSVTIGDWSC